MNGDELSLEERVANLEDLVHSKINKDADADLIQQFNGFYYEHGIWSRMKYRGVRIEKIPTDLWIYHDIISTVLPRTIIETGTFDGGSAFYFADQLRALGIADGRVISIDLVQKNKPFSDEMIDFIEADSLSNIELGTINPPVMVTLDSNHDADHVYQECRKYGELVTVGSYMVVEDTNWNPANGPELAVKRFLAKDHHFDRAMSVEKYLITHSPGGWLKRVA